MKKTDSKDTLSASQQIDNYIKDLDDWRGMMIARLRKLILDAAPELAEEWKWDTPVWSHKGNVVAAGAFKDHVKLNFFKGASLEDPNDLFNAGLEAALDAAIRQAMERSRLVSELLVRTVEPVTHQLGWSEFFVGIIIVPVVGNLTYKHNLRLRDHDEAGAISSSHCSIVSGWADVFHA